jgi:integrase
MKSPAQGPLVPSRLISDPGTGLVTVDALAQVLGDFDMAPNTRRSYATALRGFRAWHALRYPGAIFGLDRNPPAPIEGGVLVQWLLDHARRVDATTGEVLPPQIPTSIDEQLVADGIKAVPGALSLGTLSSRVAALTALHRMLGLPSPTDEPQVRRIQRAVTRAARAAGDLRQSKTAVTMDALGKMIATCDTSPKGLRDRALLLLGFASGGRRRSELHAARIEHLVSRARPDGGVDYDLLLYAGKTFSAASSVEVRRKPVAGIAADAVTAWLGWLAEQGVQTGPLFPRITDSKRKGASVSSQPIAGKTVAQIVARRAAAAGIVGDFAAHSLRAGFVTHGLRIGGNVGAIMKLTDHTNANTVFTYYYQPGDGLDGPLASILPSGLGEEHS